MITKEDFDEYIKEEVLPTMQLIRDYEGTYILAYSAQILKLCCTPFYYWKKAHEQDRPLADYMQTPPYSPQPAQTPAALPTPMQLMEALPPNVQKRCSAWLEQDGRIIVWKTGYMEKGEWNQCNVILRSKGLHWVSDGKHSHWEAP